MDLSDWHYAIVGPDLQLFRFRTEGELNDYLSAHPEWSFKFYDITLTSGLDEALWKPETDDKSGTSYEWTRAWIYGG